MASSRSHCLRPWRWRAAPGMSCEVLKFANEHRINVVPRTGRTATEGGLETSVA